MNRIISTTALNLTLLALLLLIGPIAYLQASGGSQCQCATSHEHTREGANENIVMVKREKYHRLEGVVRSVNGAALPGVLVEVFNKPDYLLLSYPESEKKKKGQKRLMGCVVGGDGKFCFRDLPPGKYELRFSKSGGWNHTHVYVIVAPRGQKASKAMLDVSMLLGT
jgi:Carboxypeptidase regulatory-like domain